MCLRYENANRKVYILLYFDNYSTNEEEANKAQTLSIIIQFLKNYFLGIASPYAYSEVDLRPVAAKYCCNIREEKLKQIKRKLMQKGFRNNLKSFSISTRLYF